MAYKIRYRDNGTEGAKSDATHWRSSYGAEFVSEFDNWLAAIAANAETRNFEGWLDAAEYFAGENLTSTARASWEKFRHASWLARLQVIATMVRTRRPPVEFYVTSATFHLLGFIAVDIIATFEVDHVSGTVVFAHFEMVDS